VKKDKVLTHTQWKAGGFGSFNYAYWVQQVTKGRPEMTLFLNEKCFGGLLGTDADVSVIAARHWLTCRGRGCSWPPLECAADLLEG
jgi:hypothetical protein